MNPSVVAASMAFMACRNGAAPHDRLVEALDQIRMDVRGHLTVIGELAHVPQPGDALAAALVAPQPQLHRGASDRRARGNPEALLESRTHRHNLGVVQSGNQNQHVG